MPNLTSAPEEIADVSAYILSLREHRLGLSPSSAMISSADPPADFGCEALEKVDIVSMFG